MGALRRLVRGLRALFRDSSLERDLTAELKYHIELETEKNIRSGLSPAAARRKALIDFGGVERFKEQTRETRPGWRLEEAVRDLRIAVRRLLRAPGFALSVILCLGLGLGATAGVFSFFFGIVLRPLPFPDADRLVALFETAPGFTRASPSFTDLEGWRENATAFSGLGAYDRTRRTVTGGEGPEILDGTRVTHDLFGILGVGPVQGRGFGPGDDSPAANPTVILGHGLWQDRFGGDPGALGSTMIMDGEPHTIIGVMPPGFAFPEAAGFWVPMRTAVSQEAGVLTAGLGRLEEGVTLARAREDMSRVAATMREAYPEANAQREIAVRPLEEDFLYGLRTPVTLFLMVAGFVLLLATANVANLLLAQGASRRREMVVRTALGAGRGRIVRQLLSESLLLAAGGGVVGVILGVLGRNLYLSFLPEAFPYYLRFDLSAPALALLAVATLGIGVLFGLAPALEATRLDLFAALRASGEGSVGDGSETSGRLRGRTLRSSLMALQTALALAVLIGAGMMARSLDRLRSIPTGLDPEKVLTLQVALSGPFRQDSILQLHAFDQIRDRVAGLAGVTGAAVVSNLPVGGGASGTSLYPEGTVAPPPGQEPWVINKQVQPGYFGVMGISLVSGRDFTEEDGAEGSPRVVIVNESFARRYWPGEQALGRRIKYGRPDSEFPWMEVVGVAADVRHFGPESPVELGIYEPFRVFPYYRENLVVKTSRDPASIMTSVREEVAAVDPQAPVYGVATMDEVLYRSYWRPVVLSRLLWIFAGVALLLAGLGVYGVLAFYTSRREKEFGIRMAMGAGKPRILGEALTLALKPCGVGILLGLLGAFAGMRVASSLMFGVASMEPGVAITAVLVLAALATLATYLPARRAAGLDPARVLRNE